ncbi:TPA: hypothetical protein ACKBRE_000643 [Streptococcus pneumoniae]|uniref:hypothetical protein n=1 Tax=Streptococcus pneumoniae TaxID=1313 RepID=UPI0005E0E26D|nr:hypothetical protein [Streptococcus pneumoniae]MDG7126015.1 hypothetical protein [Streptococcus pneumoniae]MDG7528387.1 hypothetical protein [Streptococcus pneumoniae]MDG7676470.1 hypothetical protein [Streptococcus pneumoniae]MDG7902552.1 hypothetical protein [Streptococcus pneumoniae]MDG8216795.1 hypothetical protein [Streptococcus pneumoniae]
MLENISHIEIELFKFILFENQIQTTSASPCCTQVLSVASFLVCFLIFIEYYSYGSYLWHNNIDLGVIAKILGHKDISMLVEVYGHTLEEKISEEFMVFVKLVLDYDLS